MPQDNPADIPSKTPDVRLLGELLSQCRRPNHHLEVQLATVEEQVKNLGSEIAALRNQGQKQQSEIAALRNQRLKSNFQVLSVPSLPLLQKLRPLV
jgi:predicted  nucleic acid-binding Zn-ribbon protein